MDSFWNLLRKPTEAEVVSVKSIRSIKKSYPSLKVVGRGTVVIDPKEVMNSENYKSDLIRAQKLVNS